MKKQSMDWSYMNGILRRWHEKGLHTLAAIQAGDRPQAGAGRRTILPAAASREAEQAREDME
ncbi:MAG: DnaD domain protein [Flavonifractor plautii]